MVGRWGRRARHSGTAKSTHRGKWGFPPEAVRTVAALAPASTGRPIPATRITTIPTGSISSTATRLALGTLADGRVVIALTRFDALGKAFGRVPFGLTSAEMAAVMGALGSRQALLLDGGISGQLLVREAAGTVRQWPGRRSVPLGLIGRTRPR